MSSWYLLEQAFDDEVLTRLSAESTSLTELSLHSLETIEWCETSSFCYLPSTIAAFLLIFTNFAKPIGLNLEVRKALEVSVGFLRAILKPLLLLELEADNERFRLDRLFLELVCVSSTTTPLIYFGIFFEQLSLPT